MLILKKSGGSTAPDYQTLISSGLFSATVTDSVIQCVKNSMLFNMWELSTLTLFNTLSDIIKDSSVKFPSASKHKFKNQPKNKYKTIISSVTFLYFLETCENSLLSYYLSILSFCFNQDLIDQLNDAMYDQYEPVIMLYMFLFFIFRCKTYLWLIKPTNLDMAILIHYNLSIIIWRGTYTQNISKPIQIHQQQAWSENIG